MYEKYKNLSFARSCKDCENLVFDEHSPCGMECFITRDPIDNAGIAENCDYYEPDAYIRAILDTETELGIPHD